MPATRPEKSLVLLLTALLTILVTAGGTYALYTSQQKQAAWVTHTLRIESRLSTLQSQMQAAESAQRGYLLTQEPDFLVPYTDVRNQWLGGIASLRHDVRDNPAQAQDMDALAIMIVRYLDQMQDGIDRQRTGRRIDNVQIARGYKQMALIVAQIARMKQREEALLQTRSGDAARLSTMVSGGMALTAR